MVRSMGCCLPSAIEPQDGQYHSDQYEGGHAHQLQHFRAAEGFGSFTMLSRCTHGLSPWAFFSRETDTKDQGPALIMGSSIRRFNYLVMLALLWQNLAIDWRNWIPESDFQ